MKQRRNVNLEFGQATFWNFRYFCEMEVIFSMLTHLQEMLQNQLKYYKQILMKFKSNANTMYHDNYFCLLQLCSPYMIYNSFSSLEHSFNFVLAFTLELRILFPYFISLSYFYYKRQLGFKIKNKRENSPHREQHLSQVESMASQLSDADQQS